MIVLGIESSCDETAASVVEGGLAVRSSVVASQHDLHAEYGGVVPEIASRAHAERILPIVRAAVTDAGLTLADLDAIAVGHRPGLIGSLLVGVSAAKALAWSLGIPLIGVDHIHAHLYAGSLERGDPPYPALGLVASGGHTAIYRCDSPIKLTRLGATIDDAIGEAFDKVAAILELGHPGGPQIDRLARAPGADDRAFDLPVSRLGKTSLDFSYSGLKTAVLYTVRGKPQPRRVPGKPILRVDPPPPMTDARRRNIAASFQRAAVAAVILKLERALEQSHLSEPGRPRPVFFRTLLAGGGVTANTLLRAELERFARGHNLELRLPEMDYCIDNAAMIAGLGSRLLEAGCTSGLDLPAIPTTAC